jgi:S1-C subfamily serine protease
VLKGIIKSPLIIVAVSLSLCLCARAQEATSGASAPTPPARPESIVQASGSVAPQVVTVVHRLSGMKVLSMLHRGGQSPSVVGDEFVTTRGMLTTVTAGFALGDGKSVVTRLPQAAAELEANFFWPAFPEAPLGFAPSAAQTAKPATAASPVAPAATFPSLPELLVIQRDGKPRAAKYVGLDVGTGLCLIQIEGLKSSPLRDAVEERLTAGQRVRLLAPQRINSVTASATPVATPGKLYLAVGEVEGQLIELKRSSNGQLAHLIVRAPKLTSAFAGGIAINDAGETIGIVETSDNAEARVLPMARVRKAAERVLARQGNVPQPWLGIRGQAIAAAPLSQLLTRGWPEKAAAELRAKRSGILLTAVAPNTPAALANLQSGDVILKINEDDVKSVEDFSFMLSEAGSGATVNFTVLRRFDLQPTPAIAPLPQPQVKPFEMYKPVVVSVKLSESLKPVRSTWEEGTKARNSFTNEPLAAAGVETVPLSAKAASRLGASGGLLVLYVEEESAAARAGLRLFDIIESVDGQPLSPTNAASFFNSTNTQPRTLLVVRNRAKFSFTFTFNFHSVDRKKR